MMRSLIVCLALTSTLPVEAQPQDDDGFGQFIDAQRSGVRVDKANEALNQFLEVRTPPTSPGAEDAHSTDNIYRVIFEGAMDLQSLRERACDLRIITGRICSQRFRPRWLVVPRPGLYTRRQLDRMSSELANAVGEVTGPVCAAVQAAGVAPECHQVE